MTATMEREVTTATPTAEHRRPQNGVKPAPVRPHRGRARRGGRWSGLALLLMLVALLAIVATADPVGGCLTPVGRPPGGSNPWPRP
jgi:hypothetical protein